MTVLHPELISEAVHCLRAGELVAMPTETVYGLAADARQDEALRKIFLAKGRPFSHPLIVHLASVDQLKDWASEIPAEVEVLAQTFWPGPLTLVLKKRPEVSEILSGGQDSIGLRIPSHPVAQALLRAFGDGLAAPSANRFTHLSPTTAQAVREELGTKVACVLDGGLCEVGLESTILDLSRGQPNLLRPGMISRTQLEAVLKQPLRTSPTEGPRVPGMATVHYAPETRLRLVAPESLDTLVSTFPETKKPLAVLARKPAEKEYPGVHWLMMSSEPREYAQELYFSLRELDQGQFQQIMVEAVPDEAEWEAIRDRLGKASGRRE